MLVDSQKSLLLLIDIQERLAPAMDNPRKIIDGGRRLAHAAKTLNIPMMVTENRPARFGHTMVDLREHLDTACLVEKSHYSVAREAEAARALKEINRPQVVVAGVEAHLAVLQTALDLRAQGTNVFFVTDASGSREKSSEIAGRRRMATCGVQPVTLDMVLYEWLDGADEDTFHAITDSLVH